MHPSLKNMPYTVTPTALPDVLILEPKVFGDARGFFFESFNQRDFAQATGLDVQFVQDNHSRSVKGVLRGLHYQIQHPQGHQLGGLGDRLGRGAMRRPTVIPGLTATRVRQRPAFVVEVWDVLLRYPSKTKRIEP